VAEYRALLYDPSGESLIAGGLELVERWDASPAGLLWVDISGPPDDAERRLLAGRFGISRLAIQDAQRDRHPPKVEVFDSYLFLMLRDLITAYEDSDPEVADLALFAGRNFLLSRHREVIPSLDKVFEAVEARPSILGDGSTHLAYLVSRRIVDAYTPEVLALEEHLNNLEDRLYESAGDEVIEQLSRYNRALKRTRRHLVYQANVMQQLARAGGDLPVAINRHEFTDLWENLDRLASLCQLNQELAVDLLNTHLSLLSHRLNQVMRILTIATVIFLPLGLLAGLYGMNFEYMPELGWEYGYFAVLGTMATVVVGLVAIFKRKGWL